MKKTLNNTTIKVFFEKYGKDEGAEKFIKECEDVLLRKYGEDSERENEWWD
jgi:hypothetical protein